MKPTDKEQLLLDRERLELLRDELAQYILHESIKRLERSYNYDRDSN